MQTNRTGPERRCAYCDETFRAWWPANPARFCSRSCARRYRAASNATDPVAIFHAHIRRDSDPDACWPWTGRVDEKGYGRIPLGGEVTGDGRYARAHRFAWALASGGPIPEDMHVLHTCDNPPCARYDDIGTYEVEGVLYERRGHLWLGDHIANMRDKVQKGRSRRGPAKPPGRGLGWRAKLTPDEVREVRRLHADGWSLRKIGAQFGVSKIPIQDIIHGRSRKDVA